MYGIVARNKLGVIGNCGCIPWHNKEDFAWFKFMTSHSVIVMGRNTFDSLGRQPLPNRQNVVFTNGKYDQVGVHFTQGPLLVSEFQYDDVFIIGGMQIYKLFEKCINRWYVSEIDDDSYGDIKFDINLDGFDIVSKLKLSDKCCINRYDRRNDTKTEQLLKSRFNQNPECGGYGYLAGDSSGSIYLTASLPKSLTCTFCYQGYIPLDDERVFGINFT